MIESLEEAIRGYGVVGYRTRRGYPNQIYVVGQTHRNLDGTQEDYIPNVQMRIFRIAQKLIQTFDSHLVLHEGRYKNQFYKQPTRKKKMELAEFLQEIDDNTITDSIRRGKKFYDAVSLLKYLDGVDVQGAEDNQFHWTAAYSQAILSDLGRQGKPTNYIEVYYNNINQLRTYVILKEAPFVAVREKTAGRIPNLNAIIILGISHFPELVEFIVDDGGRVEGIPIFIPSQQVSINYQKLEYDVTLIIPKGWSEDE